MSHQRNWFTFSLKQMIWLLLVAGVASRWFAESRRCSALRDAYEREQRNWEAVTQKERTARLEAEGNLRIAESELRATRLEAAQNAGGQAYARKLANENNSLKLQLKKKQGEYELLQARTAREQGVEVPVEALYEKAQLDKTIEELKVTESAAELRIENLLKFQNKLQAEIRALVSDPSGRQVATIRSLTQENTSLKAQLKAKVAEIENLQAKIQQDAKPEVQVGPPIDRQDMRKRESIRADK